MRLIVISRRADSVQSGLIRQQLQEYPPVIASAAGTDHLVAGNLQRRQSGGVALHLLLSGQWDRRRRGKRFPYISTSHTGSQYTSASSTHPLSARSFPLPKARRAPAA